MTFSSIIFVFGFMPIVILINLVIKEHYRNIWLFICSIVFYAWAQPQFVWLIVAAIIIDYFVGILLDTCAHRKAILVIGVLVNILGLVYFKYFNFLIEIYNSLNKYSKLDLIDIALPIGISFFTFKGISYIVDVYERRISAEKNLLAIAVYISMFPEIMSGPIDRYIDIRESIKKRDLDVQSFNKGIEHFIYGLSKKVILADSLGQIVDTIWSQGAGSSSWEVAWLGSLAYSLQLYYDFSGYSDMAVGIGKMLGFNLIENFNYPYVSKSVTEFWRRWHISLGNWFKYYIYIPLGGNRKRVYLNIFIVFLLTGIWHGSSWTFIIWGVLHGVFRLFEKTGERLTKTDSSFLFHNFLSHIYLLFFINLTWVIFRAPDITDAILYLKSMFGVVTGTASGLSLKWFLTRWNVFVLGISTLLCMPIVSKIKKVRRFINIFVLNIIRYSALIMLFIFSSLRLVTETYTSFIYFKF